MKKTKNRAWFSGAVFLSFGALLVFFVMPRFDHVNFDTVEATNFNTSPTRISLEATVKGSTMTEDLASENHIWTLCPVEEWAHDYKDNYLDYRSQISEECLEAVGNYLIKFPRKLGRHYITRLLVISNPMTYERVFADPKADRAKVLDALSRRECQFQEGELVRWDLKDDCHAVAFANYANFLSLCRSGFYLLKWHEENESMRVVLVNFYDPWEDFEVRKVVFQRDVEQEWVYQQCRSSGIENLLFDHEGQDQDIFRLLTLVGENVGEESMGSTYRDLRIDVQRVLIALAARFGEDWAILEYRGPKIWPEDSWDQWIKRKQPWRELQYLRSINWPPTEKKLTVAIDFIIALEDADVRIDWEMFVSDLCYYESKRKKNTCQSTIESLSDELDPNQHVERVRVITQFKQVAQRLGVYANPSPIARDRRYLYDYSYDRTESKQTFAP